MELEQLKQQWDILHQKLDKQQIINKQLMENVVRQKIDFISSYNWIGVAIGVAIILLLLFVRQERDVDDMLVYIGIGMVIFFLIGGIYKALQFNKTKSFKNDIVSVEKFMLKFEQQSFWYYAVILIVLLGFIISVAVVYFDRLVSHNRFWIFATFIIVSIFVGIREMKWYVGKVKNLRQSISDLKEFEKE